MDKLRKITDTKVTALLFFLCWFAYFTSYIGRMNYSSAMASIIQDAVLTKSQAGFISMVYFFAYGIGQMCNGILGDRLPPGGMIFTGLAVAGAANFVMCFGGSFILMSLVWGINGYAQSMIWPPIVRIFAEMLEDKTRLKFCINIASSSVAGTLCAYLMSAGMLYLAGWKAVFAVAGVCLSVMSAAWAIGFKKVKNFSEKYGYLPQQEIKGKIGASKKKKAGNVTFTALMYSSGLLVVIFPTFIHGILKDGVTTWIPTYITETFLASPAFSILVTTVLPVLNLSGAYAANYVYQKYRKRELPSAAFFFALALAALIGIWRFGYLSVALTVVLFGIVTTAMLAVNTIFISLLPLRFDQFGRVSTVTGFLNSMAYIGTAVSTFTIGLAVDRLGWSITIGSWVVIAAAALAVCIAFRNRQSSLY